MKHNCLIKGVCCYHPEHKVGNDYYIEHFKKQGKDISGLLKATGRNNRYISDDMDETMLTMGCKAAKMVLDHTHVKACQLNMLIFSSGTPEYIAPSNAIKVHAYIEAGQNCIVYDLNANCAGMVVAFEQIARIMRSNPNVKYAMLVGSDQLNRYSRYNEAIAYSNFGDSACAMILENVFDTDRGFIDSDFYTNSSNHDKILMPARGMTSAIHDKRMEVKDKLVEWIDFNLDGAFYSAKISIEDILFKNNLNKRDVRRYFISQFAKKNIESVCSDLEEDPEKFTFIGDEFGYTGTTSPILAFHRSVNNRELDIGDNVIFWTVGAGTTCVCVLYRF